MNIISKYKKNSVLQMMKKYVIISIKSNENLFQQTEKHWINYTIIGYWHIFILVIEN